MPNSLSPERKGYELRTRFIVAILAHAICDKGSSMHSFANTWLQSDTLATILCCNYRFSSDLLFTGNDIVTAFVQKKEKLHTEFGLDCVHQPFALNHFNLYKYEYQVQEFIMNVTKAYFTVLLAESNVKVAQEQVKATEATLKQTKMQNVRAAMPHRFP